MAERPLSYDPLAVANSLASHKESLLREVRDFKQSQLSPAVTFAKDEATLSDDDFLRKYGEAEAMARFVRQQTERRNRELEAVGRTDDQALRDLPEALGRGANRFISGTINALTETVTQSQAMANTRESMQQLGLGDPGPSAVSAAGQAVQQTVSDVSQKVDQTLAARMSALSRVSERNAQIDAAQLQAARAEQYAIDTEVLGESPILAGAKRIGGDFIDAVGNQLDHPIQLSNTIVGEVPALLTAGPAARALSTGSQVSRRADELMELALSRRAGQSAPLPNPAALAAQAGQDVQRSNAIRTTIGMEASGQYGNAYQEVQQTPLAELAANNPEVQAAIDAGESEENIKHSLGVQRASIAAGVTAVIGAPLARLNPEFELAPLSLRGNARAQRLASVPGSVASESVEETGFGALGAFGENVAAVATGDEGTSLTEGVGSDAGQGLVTAAGLTAGMQAPGVAANALGLSAQAAQAGAKVAGEVLNDRVQKIEEARQTQVQPEVDARKSQLDEAEAVIRQAAPAVTEDTGLLLNEQIQTMLRGSENPAADRTMPNLVEQVDLLKTRGTELSAEQRRDLSLAIQRTGRQMTAAYNEHFAGLSDEQLAQNPPETAALVQAFRTLLSDEEVGAILQGGLDAETDEVDQEILSRVEADAAPTPQDLERALEISYSKPDLITEKVAEQLALFQKTKGEPTPAQQQHLAAVGSLAPAIAAHAQQAEAIEARVSRGKELDKQIGVGGSGVTMSAVTKMVQTEGMGSKKRSLVQYARDIAKAASTGDTEGMTKDLEELQNFARHFQEKAIALDDIATTAFESGDAKIIDSRKDTPYRQLRNDGSLSDTGGWLIPGNEKSVALVDQVYNDANTIVAQYNHMARTYLGASAPQLDQPGSPRYHQAKATYDQAPAAPAVPGSAPAAGRAAPAPAAIVPEPAPVEPAAVPTEQAPDRTEAPAEQQPTSEVEASPVEDAPAEDDDAAALAKILAEAQAIADGAPALKPRATGTLEQALAMTEAEYLDAINPGGKPTSESESDELIEELREAELPDRASYLRDVDGISYFRDDNFVYAVDAFDGELVGQIATGDTGTTLAVWPTYEGRGIGTELTKEVLRVDPFAPAGSLTEATRKTRLKALQALRSEQEAEQEAENAPSVLQRYPGLRPEALDGESLKEASQEDKLKSRNRLLTAFTFNPNGSGLFARVTNPIQALGQAFTAMRDGSDPSALRALLPEHYRNSLRITGKQAKALEQITTKHVPEMTAALNRMLDFASRGMGPDGKQRYNNKDKAKGFIEALRSGKPNWHLERRMGLFATRWGQTKDGNFAVRYQPEIAQAMALAAVQWANRLHQRPAGLSLSAIEENYPTVSPEIKQAMLTQHLGRDSAQELGQTLMELLGLSINAKEFKTYTQGVPYALALEAINMLEQSGWIEIQEIASNDTERTTTSFITIPETSPVIELTEDLEGDSLLPKFLTPDSITAIEVGAPVTTSKQAVQGTRQPLSEEQLANQKRAQQQEHTLNLPWLNDLTAIGLANLERLRGYVDLSDLPDIAMNVNDRKAQEGINTALRAGYISLVQLQSEVRTYATENQQDVDKVPLHFGWRTISSMRSMMNQTLNPQGNKDVRELVSPHDTTMDLTDPEQRKVFLLALAQAMGEKTEKQLHAVSIDNVLNLFEELSPVLEAWNALHEAQQTEDGDTIAAAGQVLSDALFDSPAISKPMTARALNALSHYSRFILASQTADGLKSFRVQLALEADGKTDGMFNAMFHFGLNKLGPVMLKQLRQGGLFIEQAIGSLNDDQGKQGDLYLNVTDRLQTRLRGLLRDLPDTDPRARGLVRAINLLTRVDEMGLTPSQGATLIDDLVVKRSLGKEPMTQQVYGSTMHSIMRGKAESILAHVYKEMSASLLDGTELPPELVNNLRPMMQKKKVGRDWVAIDPPNLTNVAGYAKFSFTADQVQALTDNLMSSVGKELGKALEVEMSPVLDTFKKLYAISGIQGFRLKVAYTKAVDERRQALLDAGEMLPHEALSQYEETQILKSLAHLAPIYGTLMGGKVDLSTREDGDPVTRLNKGKGIETVRARGISGGKISLPITQTGIGAPGVRAAALVTQGGGDATMMQRFLSLLGGNDTGDTLDVFDGLEMTLTKALTQGRLINQASWEGLQFDLLGEFEKASANLEDYDFRAELMANPKLAIETFGKQSALDAGMAMEEILVNIAGEIAFARETLPVQSAQIRAMKRAIAERSVSNDHMATTNTPFALNGGTRDSAIDDETLALELQARAAELLEDESHRGTAKPDAALEKELMAAGTVTELDKAGLAALIQKVPLRSNVQAFLFNRLLPLLPDSLRVYSGTPSALQAKKFEVLPHRDPSELGTGFEPGLMVDGKIFLSVASPETLVHEVLHVVVQDLLTKFYDRKGKGLTPAQRGAVLQLEKLTQAFAALQVDRDAHPMERSAVESAQATVNGLIERNTPQATAAAVNEFLAWSLTNAEVGRVLKAQKTPSTVMRLAKQARHWIRKLLGLPENAAVVSFFDTTLGNFLTLTEQAEPVKAVNDTALFQRLAEDSTHPHDLQVAEVYQRFREMLLTLPEAPDKIPGHAARPLLAMAAETSRNQLKDTGGMQLSPSEELAFDSIHAVLSSGLSLDPVVLHSLSDLRSHALEHLTYADLVPDVRTASFSQRDQARKLLEMLDGKGVGKDAQGRSLVLANFVAASQTYAPLRQALLRLELPKQVKAEGTVDSFIRQGTTNLFNKLSDRALGLGNAHETRTAFDILALRLEKDHQRAREAENVRTNRLARAVDRAEEAVKSTTKSLTQKGLTALEQRQAKEERGRVENTVRSVVSTTLEVLDNPGAIEGVVETINEMNLPTAMMELLSDAIGSTPLTQDLYALLDRVKHVVATARQRLREEAPQQVREFFKTPLTAKDGALLMHSVARTDLQILVGTYSLGQINTFLGDDVALDQAIQRELTRLPGHVADYTAAAQQLAKVLVTRKGAPRYRNAQAMARLLGQAKVSEEQAERSALVLDRVITLMAIKELPTSQRDATAELLGADKDGTRKLLMSLRSLGQQEKGKNPGKAHEYNGWKGYVPESRDPRSHVVLATPVQALDLVKRGYRRVGAYVGDPADSSAKNLAYYAIDHAGGPATFVQGVLQTVSPTFQGLNLETGLSLAPGVGTVVRSKFGVSNLQRQVQGFAETTLAPLYDDNGDTVGFERALDPAVLESHLRGEPDLAGSIGVWMGRQMEEKMAQVMNREAVKSMRNMYDRDSSAGKQTYIDLVTSTNPVHKDIWNALPVETQRRLKGAFDGKALVRPDMLRNLAGYRMPSIGDVFTGLTNLPEPVRKQVYNVAVGLLGPDAYRKLVAAERAWEGAVGTAKDFIIVRSGVVALGNALSNVLQLMAHGVPLLQIPRLLGRKAQETEIHLRNEKRLAQLTLQLQSASTQVETDKLKIEANRLLEENKRLSIAPLIDAGGLPTIAEGLTEQDQYNVFSDLIKKIEEKAGALPDSVVNAAKIAVISRDTALYQGLNRIIQFGDFTAKAVIYDQLLADGVAPKEAMAKVSERFVNYNRNAGRSRDKLESLGLLWFSSYKVRIQKVILSTLRENPLRFLLSGAIAHGLDQDSLISTSLPAIDPSYSIGTDQFWRANEMLFWNQMFG